LGTVLTSVFFSQSCDVVELVIIHEIFIIQLICATTNCSKGGALPTELYPLYPPKLGDIQNMKVENLKHPFILQAIEVKLFSTKQRILRGIFFFQNRYTLYEFEGFCFCLFSLL
jgi:hypothetical protein